MPWSPKDVPKYKKGLTQKEKERWCKIANSVLEQCRKDKGKNCDKKAIKVANSKVGNNKNSEEVNGVKKKTLKVPKEGFQFFSEDSAISFKEVDDEGKPKSFSMEAYTGAIMPDIFGGSIAVDVSGIEFDGKKRFPILEDHEWDNKIGVSNSRPNMEDSRVSFDAIKVLSNEKAQEFAQNLADGFPYQASISVRPKKIEEVPENESADVNGMKMKGPGIILRSSLFREASVCVFGRDTKTGVKSLSDSDYDEMEVEVFSQSADDQKKTKTPKKNGGNSMLDLTAIKEEHPDLVKQINAALKEKDDSITSLTTERDELKTQVTSLTQERDNLKKEKEDLSAANTESENRIAALERSEAVRKEQDIKNKADSITDKKLSNSQLPERLHKRVKKQIDHNQFVSDEGVFDETKFSETVDAEINSWVEDLKDTSTSESIMGLSGGGSPEEDFSSDSDKLSDRMVELAGGVDNSQKKE